MRSSKSRSRSKTNRPRTLGNIINRVFDSSGPEGKVRGTPQQIIEKYLFLARDAQLSNDRVAAENFLQHAEHYTRMLGEAQREMAAEQETRQQFQPNQSGGQYGNGQGGSQQPGNGNGGNGSHQNGQNATAPSFPRERQQNRDDRDPRPDYRAERDQRNEQPRPEVQREDRQRNEHARPENGRPENARSENSRSENSRSENTRQENLRNDPSRADQPGSDQPMQDQTRPDAPRSENARPDTTRSENARSEQPRSDRSRNQQPRGEQRDRVRPVAVDVIEIATKDETGLVETPEARLQADPVPAPFVATAGTVLPEPAKAEPAPRRPRAPRKPKPGVDSASVEPAATDANAAE